MVVAVAQDAIGAPFFQFYAVQHFVNMARNSTPNFGTVRITGTMKSLLPIVRLCARAGAITAYHGVSSTNDLTIRNCIHRFMPDITLDFALIIGPTLFEFACLE